MNLLSEAVKGNLSVEDRINRRLAGLVAEGGRRNSQNAEGVSQALRSARDSPLQASGGESQGMYIILLIHSSIACKVDVVSADATLLSDIANKLIICMS